MALEPVSILRVTAALLENASVRCQLDFQRAFISTLIERLVDRTDALARQR